MVGNAARFRYSRTSSTYDGNCVEGTRPLESNVAIPLATPNPVIAVVIEALALPSKLALPVTLPVKDIVRAACSLEAVAALPVVLWFKVPTDKTLFEIAKPEPTLIPPNTEAEAVGNEYATASGSEMF